MERIAVFAGLPLVGKVPLVGSGGFGLGDELSVDFEAAGGALILRVATGLDRGVTLIAGVDGQRLDLAPAGLGIDLLFRKGARCSAAARASKSGSTTSRSASCACS